MRRVLSHVLAACIGVCAIAGWADTAAAQKRIALLIGNQAYKPGVGALVNPLNDVRLVSQALAGIGFEVLEPAQNARRSEMLLAIHNFAAKLKAVGPDAVGFLYYSGHGLASAGENYLIPVDLDEPSTVQLSVQGVRQSEVLAILRSEAPNAAHYIVLDACRNTLQGSRGGKGFVPVGQQSGVLIAFAAEPGKTASDLGQGSGPYAAALAAELVKPGQSDLIMFHNVRVAVIEKTRGDQVPWTEDGIQRRQRVQFGGDGRPPAPNPAAPPPSQTYGGGSEAERAWALAKDTTSIAILEAFASRYKDTFYADLARARIEELRKKPAVAAVEAPPPIAAPKLSLATPDGDTLPVFFVTNRLRSKDRDRIVFTGERDRQITVGLASINWPKRSTAPGDKGANFNLRGISLLEHVEMRERMARELARATRATKQALIYVHGYDLAFDNALYRSAQIAYDIGFDGIVVLYSWPSRGGQGNYSYDRESAASSVPMFREFLDWLAQLEGIERIHLIGHSMGNTPIVEALGDLAQSKAAGGKKIGQVVLAAPDMDPDVLQARLAVATTIGAGYTLYVSANDKALIAARRVSGGVPRAGDVPASGPLIIAGVDTIDVTQTANDFLALNHSTYTERSTLLNDIGLLLLKGERPPHQRVPVLEQIATQRGTYWRFPGFR